MLNSFGTCFLTLVARVSNEKAVEVEYRTCPSSFVIMVLRTWGGLKVSFIFDICRGRENIDQVLASYLLWPQVILRHSIAIVFVRGPMDIKKGKQDILIDHDAPRFERTNCHCERAFKCIRVVEWKKVTVTFMDVQISPFQK
jgi:hypothetical protein